ncbi:gamma-glutamylcyclotransferase [Pseudonocardia eucalypti]|uniref:Gamma-glutamylcyclotransferase n=1 Tax=Pseudonocardia eucalypti TaxID=648755 RepID=A0ABP9R3Q0_9PSEU|nr:hypothetical protein [Pseudonocardia eucalypti]
MRDRFPDEDYPADPYPGGMPDGSFVHLDGLGHRIVDGGVRGEPLDDWLAGHGAPPLTGRFPVLAYGSNRCPSKITWLRAELGLTGPVVVLAVVAEGLAAVWATGVRKRDGQRPAVLAAAPGVTERHSLWLATPEQLAVLDVCEGRGERYRLARLRTGEVRTETGTEVDRPYCYLGLPPHRRPLLMNGDPVRCEEVDQVKARELIGAPAPDDGLTADEVSGAPTRVSLDPSGWLRGG